MKQSVDSVEEIQREIVAFIRARDWQQFHDAKSLCMAISSEAGELAAVLRWVATENADSVARGPETNQRLAAEIGDVGILLLELCHRTDIQFLDAIRAKLRINAIAYPAESSRGKPERSK